MQSFVAFMSPILSTLIITFGTLTINRWFKVFADRQDRRDAETDAKRKAEAEWRESIERKLDDIENKVNHNSRVQSAQLRSDIVHKCHRYLDDLGKAGTEEKEALHDEHEQYAQFCDDLDMPNNFIDNLVERVMALPER